MYSYQFPVGYSGFAQDLNQSLNEFLFEPVLPVFTVDYALKANNVRHVMLESRALGFIPFAGSRKLDSFVYLQVPVK